MPNVPLSLKIFPALYGTFDVAQGTANLDALHASESILAQNGVLGVFPEGRVHPSPLKPALPGAAFLALRTGAPILPIGIYSDNDWDIFGTIRETHRRLRIFCKVGDVFGPLKTENPRRPSREEIGRAGGEIMRAIAACLPPEMRGECKPER
jgi:1-acyl-sn-glycerol-3-phosphate acyltransferase